MVGYIYLITDTTNGMKYTGKHHYHIEGQLDPNYHGSGTIIKNIYKKRPETLKEEYIKTCYSEEEMCSDEQYYIKVFKTLWPNGYNLTEGGDGGEIPCEEIRKKISLKLKGRTPHNKGKHLSEETRKKISAANKSRHLSEESRKKMFGSNKGKHFSEEHKRKISNSLKGKPKSEEQKKKLSENMKGKMLGEKNPMFGKHHTEESKKKICESKKNISDETRRKISNANKGRTSPNKGKPMSEEQKKKLSKKVLQFTLDDEFIREWPSVAEVGRNGYNFSHIAACCRGEYKQAYGFKWCYAEE